MSLLPRRFSRAYAKEARLFRFVFLRRNCQSSERRREIQKKKEKSPEYAIRMSEPFLSGSCRVPGVHDVGGRGGGAGHADLQRFPIAVEADRGSRGLQPLHLPPAAHLHRLGSNNHVHALRQRPVGQGLHRQGDQEEQVLR